MITYSLTKPSHIERFLHTNNESLKTINLSMPMSEDRSVMRYSLIPHILESVYYNKARTNDSVSFFEIGNRYSLVDNKTREEMVLAGAVTGVDRCG